MQRVAAARRARMNDCYLVEGAKLRWWRGGLVVLAALGGTVVTSLIKRWHLTVGNRRQAMFQWNVLLLVLIHSSHDHWLGDWTERQEQTKCNA